MQTIKARGLVLREYEAGESDKRLLVLCKEHGRMMIYARGARKPKSKYMGATQLFTYADFVLTAGRGFYALTQADIIESFYGLRTDYDYLTAAHIVAEVCEKTLHEDIACDDLLLLALRSLAHLSKQQLPSLQVVCVFLLRFFVFYGLAPRVEACALCNEAVDREAFFCVEGLACNDCRPNRSIPVSMAAVFALRHILLSPMSPSFLFKAHDDVIKELMLAARLLWNFHFDRHLASWKFI